MNDDRIREVSDIAELAHLREDDPRRIEAMRSPRTRALLATYQDFLTQPPAEPLPGARLADADRRLAEALDRELALPATAVGDPGAATTEPRRALKDAPRRGLLELLFAPALRPAFALAAVVLVAGTVWMATSQRRTPTDEPVMRGDAAGSFRAQIQSQTEGRATLTWTAVTGADHYELRFYAQDLAERGRVDLGPETRVELVAGQLPVGLLSGEVMLWQAFAMKGHDVLAESPTATIRLP